MKAKNVTLKSIGVVFSAASLETIVCVICYILTGLSPSVISWSIARIVATLSAGGGADDYYLFAVIIIAAMLIECLCNFILSICMNAGVFEKSNAFCRQQMIRKSSRLNFIDYEDVSVLEKEKRAARCVDYEIMGMIFMLFIQLAANVISLVSLAAVLGGYSPFLVLISLLSVIPFLFVRMIRGKKMYEVKRANVPAERKVNYYFSLFCEPSSVRDVRLLGIGGYLKGKWSALRYRVNDEIRKQNRKEAVIIFVCELLTAVGLMSAIAVSLGMTLNGALSLAAFSAGIYAFQSMQSTSQQLFGNLGTITEYKGYAADYFEFLSLEERKEGHHRIKALDKQIEFKNVSFSYPGGEPALDGINAVIPAGQVVALVGHNGSGKTTFSKLLSGAYHADSGEILFDNHNIATLDGSLTDLFGVVVQSPTHFNFTVSENVAMGDETPDEEKVKNALAGAGLAMLGDKTDSRLGKAFGGGELSGGEWQKLAIARCIYKDAPILMLDEPTSALDPIMEVSVLKDFIALSKGKTSVIISHRIGICKYVDRVIVLKGGKIAEDGTHDELMKARGEYYAMYKNQSQYYESES